MKNLQRSRICHLHLGKFQDFLSASKTDVEGCNPDAYDPSCAAMKHEGAYTELQIGPARTQMHTFPLAAKSTYEWTEWFKAWQADPKVMQDADYSVPVGAVNAWLASSEGMSNATLAEADEMRSAADGP